MSDSKIIDIISAEKFATWSNKLSINEVPPEVIKKIKLVFLDSMGLIFASRNEKYIKSLKNSFTDKGMCIIPGHKEKLNPFDAILLNGTAIHGEDFDDTFEGTPVHIGSVMVPSILTSANYYNISADKLLLSMVIGSELICRLALVSPMAIHKKGFHPTAILGAFGSSAGISKILGNNIKQTSSSLGIVGSMSSGIIEYLAEGTWTKRIHPGWAAACGWKSAHLGKQDFKGPRSVFDGKNGIFKTFAVSSISPNYSEIYNNLGTKWHANDIALKPFACGTMTQPFIDCAIKARNKINDYTKIKRINCKVGEGTVHRLWEPLEEKRNPTTPYSAKFSVPYCISIGLILGKAGLVEFTNEQIKNTDILRVCSKIFYQIDPYNEYPDNYSGEIEIILEDGEIIIEKQPSLRGGKLFPMSEKEVIEKFFKNLEFGKLTKMKQKKIEQFVNSFFIKPDFSLLN